MELGLIGLGKMGGNMRERLRRAGHTVVGYDRNPDVSDADSIEAMVEALPSPKVVWVMVPSGDPTRETVKTLGGLLVGGRHRHRRRQLPLDRRHRARRAPRREGHRLRRLRCLRRRLGAGERLRADGRRLPGRHRDPAADLRRAQARGRVRLGARRQGRRRALLEDGPQRHRVRRDAVLRRGLRAAAEGRAGRQRHRGLPLLARGHRDPVLAARPARRRARRRRGPRRASAATPRTRARAGGPSRRRSSTPYRCTPSRPRCSPGSPRARTTPRR